MVIIRESYINYQSKAARLHPNLNRRWSDVTVNYYDNDTISNLRSFFKMHLLQAALPHEIQNVLSQKDQTRNILDQMNNIPTTQLRKNNFKKPNMENIDEAWAEDNDITTFQCRQNRQGTRPKSTANQARLARPNLKARQGPGSNIERNRMYCYYRKLQGQREEESQWRIWETNCAKAGNQEKIGQTFMWWTQIIKSEQKRQQLVFH